MKTYSIKHSAIAITSNTAISALLKLQKIKAVVYNNNEVLKLTDDEILKIMYNNAFDIAVRGGKGISRGRFSIDFSTDVGELKLTQVMGRIIGTFKNYTTDQLIICGNLNSIQRALETLLDLDDAIEQKWPAEVVEGNVTSIAR